LCLGGNIFFLFAPQLFDDSPPPNHHLYVGLGLPFISGFYCESPQPTRVLCLGLICTVAYDGLLRKPFVRHLDLSKFNVKNHLLTSSPLLLPPLSCFLRCIQRNEMEINRFGFKHLCFLNACPPTEIQSQK